MGFVDPSLALLWITKTKTKTEDGAGQSSCHHLPDSPLRPRRLHWCCHGGWAYTQRQTFLWVLSYDDEETDTWTKLLCWQILWWRCQCQNQSLKFSDKNGRAFTLRMLAWLEAAGNGSMHCFSLSCFGQKKVEPTLPPVNDPHCNTCIQTQNKLN